MPDIIRCLVVSGLMHHPKHHHNVEANCGKSLYHQLFDRLLMIIPESGGSLAEDQPLAFTKQPPRFLAHAAVDSESPIHCLPNEVILEIASNATPCSRACLALTSKTLLSVISGGFSMLFSDLRLPAELPEGNPPYFVANDWPLIYQPERWEFLCLLQKDSRQWLACSDCFVLHPAQWFGQTEVAVWPLKLSWPQCRPPNLEHLSRDRVARGIVEICQCIQVNP